MEPQEVRNCLDAERHELVRDGESIQRLTSVTRLASSDRSQHTLIWSSLTAANADAVIQEQIDHYRQLSASFEWKVYSHDAPADLPERLGSKGFEIGPREVVLAFDLATRSAWIDHTAEVDVVRVDWIQDVAIYRHVAEAVFGKDYSFTTAELTEAIRRGSTQHRGYIGYVGESPASIGRLYLHPKSKFGGLYGGGTLSPFRGRGAYRAVVAARARDAVASGARYLIVDALPTSQPILERLGFVRIADTWPCTWKA